jgi:hypothetical protein
MATPGKREASLPANEQPASKKPKNGPSDEVYIDLASNNPRHSVPIISQDQAAREDLAYDTCFGLVFTSPSPLLTQLLPLMELMHRLALYGSNLLPGM